MILAGIPPYGIVLIVIGVIVLMLMSWIISTTNAFRRMIVKIDESESSIDVALTKRFDLLNKLFSATKGYMKHEKETLTEVVAMRQPTKSAPMADKQKFADEVTKGLQAINVVVEQYPDLKANTSVNKLMDGSTEVEENLQAARRVYNANVSYYNQRVVVFPSNIIARWRGFKEREFFEAEEVKRQDVKFDF